LAHIAQQNTRVASSKTGTMSQFLAAAAHRHRDHRITRSNAGQPAVYKKFLPRQRGQARGG
jgi:hypothetical protein